MSLSQEKLDEINNKKIISFLSPLLLGLKDDESYVDQNFNFDLDDQITFNFNRSLAIFSDIRVYRHLSIIGILNTFDRSLKYEILNLAILLDIWYNESTIISKDKLRTCDLLIIHGTNDPKFGINKSLALIDLINTRKSFGKITWLFIHGCDADTFSKDQPNVLNEISNIYNINLINKNNLLLVLNEATSVSLIDNSVSDNTEDNHII